MQALTVWRAVPILLELGTAAKPGTRAESTPGTYQRTISPPNLFDRIAELVLQAAITGHDTYCWALPVSALFRRCLRYFTENGDTRMERMLEQVLKNTDTVSINDMRGTRLPVCRQVWEVCWRRHRNCSGERLTITTLSQAMNDVLDEARFKRARTSIYRDSDCADWISR